MLQCRCKAVRYRKVGVHFIPHKCLLIYYCLNIWHLRVFVHTGVYLDFAVCPPLKELYLSVIIYLWGHDILMCPNWNISNWVGDLTDLWFCFVFKVYLISQLWLSIWTHHAFCSLFIEKILAKSDCVTQGLVRRHVRKDQVPHAQLSHQQVKQTVWPLLG